MEDTKLTISNGCKNNYNEETFITEFAKDDNCIKKCSSCPNFSYDNGTVTCKKFNMEG